MIRKTELPRESILNNYFSEIDYLDSFMSKVNPVGVLTIDDVIKTFLTSAPSWVISLMKVRDKLAKALKLKTHSDGDPSVIFSKTKFNVGEKYGLFEITEKKENEAILGTDDSHLNFRVSLYINKTEGSSKELYISTIVKINNKKGWIYFNTIDQFHRAVVKSFLKKMSNNINKNF